MKDLFVIRVCIKDLLSILAKYLPYVETCVHTVYNIVSDKVSKSKYFPDHFWWTLHLA